MTWTGDSSGASGMDGLDLFGRTFDVGAVVSLIVALVCVATLLAILMMVVKYVVQAGVYRSLDRLEGEGAVPTVRTAWHEGWSSRTWRLWLQNLVVDIPFAIVAVATLLIAAIPLIVGLVAGGGEPPAAFVLGSVGLFVAWLFIVLAVGIVVGALKQLWWRAAVVGDESFLTAIRTGWRMARRNRSDVAIMILLMIGAGIVWGVAVMVLIVVFLLLTGGVAALPAYLIFRSVGSVGPALLYGVPAAIVTFVVPLAIAGGLFLIFEASVWTQVYRSLTRRATAEA